ncbi:MAG TPA: polysaccharide biosynthesis tyrosine autokinase [Candidatus Koribacter sp.]
MRRAIIGWTLAAGFVLATAAWLLMPPKYAAETHLEFNPENPAAFEVNNPESAPAEDYAVNLTTQANVIESDTLALQVIQQLNLEQVERSRARFHIFRDEPDNRPLEQSPLRRTRMLKKFHQRLTVRPLGGTRLLQVRYLDRDPALAAAVANTLVNDYLEQYFQTRYTATRQASDWLSNQLYDLKADVESSQQRLADYQKQTGILGESETNNVVMAKLEELNKQLSAAQANGVVKQAVWQLAKTGDPELISSVAGNSFLEGVSGGANNSQLALLPSLRAQEAQLKADIAQTSARLGPNFPKLQAMRSQLADLQASIDAEVRKIAARAQNDYLAAKNAEDMERALFDKQKEEANRLNDSAIQYGILKRDVDASRDLYQGLVGKLKQAGVLAGLRSSNIVVIDPARAPAKPASPNILLNLALGILGGLVTGVGVALVRDGTDTTIWSPRHVQAAGMRVLSVIPQVKPEQLRSADVEEPCRALRTSLRAPEWELSPKVVVVTSSLPQEGKSTVAATLARVLAQQGGRVLLIDADLRRPAVHTWFEIPADSPGLAAALAECDRASIPNSEGVYVLAGGPRAEHPAELLASARMAESMAHWRKEFDHIVIDTPPVLSVTDAVIVGQLADAVLLVVRAGRSTAETLERTQELLADNYVSVHGAVLNAMDFRSAEYAHYFGHSYADKELHEYIRS